MEDQDQSSQRRLAALTPLGRGHTSSTMLSILSEAIRSQSVVTFVYRSRRRYVEPHIVGYDQEGAALLLAWQLTAINEEDFRSFRLDMMSGMTKTARCFAGPRAGYNPNDRLFSRVLSRL